MNTSWLSWWLVVNNLACQSRRCKSHRFEPWVGKIPWRRKWQPTPVFLPGKSHGQRSLVGCRGVTRVGYSLMTKPPPMNSGYWWMMRLQINCTLFFTSVCSIWLCTMSMYYCFHFTFPRVTCCSLVVGLPPADCLARNNKRIQFEGWI